MPVIKGSLYRIHTLTGNDALFEVPPMLDGDAAMTELKKFVAEYAADGHIVTSVTRILPTSRDTPRVSVMDKEWEKLYKEAVQARNDGKEKAEEEGAHDPYKVNELKKMLAQETQAGVVHYGANLRHPDKSIMPLTIDAGGIQALIDYYSTHRTDLEGD